MYDRYDSSKGRYVTYEYQAKGDRFSRGLSATPRVWTAVTQTGRTFKRRVRTSDAHPLTVSRIKELVRPELAATLEQHTLYFLEVKGTILIGDKPIGFPVRFEVTEQHKGKRHWFRCVGCGRRVGKLFNVQTGQGKVWGCQKCLGLSYPSQARHKSPGRDMAIIEGKIKVGFDEWCRAHERYEKRMRKLIAKFDGLAEGLSKHTRRT